MTDNWYYAAGDKSIGPLSLADLTTLFHRQAADRTAAARSPAQAAGAVTASAAASAAGPGSPAHRSAGRYESRCGRRGSSAHSNPDPDAQRQHQSKGRAHRQPLARAIPRDRQSQFARDHAVLALRSALSAPLPSCVGAAVRPEGDSPEFPALAQKSVSYGTPGR
jgi:hypothetical protein